MTTIQYVCVCIISGSLTTPQCLSLISHERLGGRDVWNHRRCETGCETVVISYVISLLRRGGLNHTRHSPLAANHAANDKWNIRLPLITMASQGQDLTLAHTHTDAGTVTVVASKEHPLQSFTLFSLNQEQTPDTNWSEALWIWHLMAD